MMKHYVKLERQVATTYHRFWRLRGFKQQGFLLLFGYHLFFLLSMTARRICWGFGLLSPSGSERHHLFWIWGDDAGRKSRILYQQLDRDFPGMKEKYQQAFGDRYVCDSPNQQKLMAIFCAFCQTYQILYRPEEVFAYIHRFEDQQLTLF